MIRERNDRSANSQNHRWVDFTMRKGDLFSLFGSKIAQMHRNHSCLLFFDVQEFNQPLLTASLEIPFAAIARSFLFKQFLNVKFPHLYFVVFNNIQRALNSSCISAKTNFFSCKVSQYRNFSLDAAISSQSNKVLVKLISITCEPYPIAINKHFGLLLIHQICARNLLKLFHTPILKLVNNIVSIGTD